MIKNIKMLLLVSLTFVACTTKEDEVIVDNNSSDNLPLTAGTADFSKYVALGDSFAAGFSDNALFIEGQKGSYPAVLAQQFKLVGGGDFKIPFMADNVGGFAGSAMFTPRLYLAPPTTPGGSPSPSSVALPPYNQVSTTTFAPLIGAYNNMGIPGAKSFHLVTPGYGSSAGNPYFARFASAPLKTVLDDALSQNPTFFSLWIGGNDVLGYATSGGINASDITSPTTFETSFNKLITDLTAGGKKGVIANLPYVNSLPYFTTIPVNAVPALPASQSGSLNQLFGGINGALVTNGLPKRFVTITTDDGNPATVEATNPLLIIDESLIDISTQITSALTPLFGVPAATFLGGLYGKARHARTTDGDRDFILLPTRGLITPPNNIQAGLPPGLEQFSARGVSYPLQDSAVLTADEALQIKTATDAYNVTISAAAASKNLAFFDSKETMRILSTTGITGNGYTLTSGYITGGAFSLDGVHPSPRGYALIANEFIKAINLKYGSNLKGVNFADYRIMFPGSL
jgi:hypothetical protein